VSIAGAWKKRRNGNYKIIRPRQTGKISKARRGWGAPGLTIAPAIVSMANNIIYNLAAAYLELPAPILQTGAKQ